MSSDIHERAAQAQELRDTQEAYRKRKQAVEAEGQEQLQQARKETAQKIREELSSGEAAVNHVRATNKDRAEATRVDGERNITYERNAVAKRFGNTQEHGEEQLETLNRDLASNQEHLKKNIKQVVESQAELRSREAETNSKIMKEQSQLRSKIVSGEQAEIAKYRDKAAQQKTVLNAQARKEISETVEKNRAEINNLKTVGRENHNKQLELSERQLKLQAAEASRRLENQRQVFSKNQEVLGNKARKALNEKQSADNERINKIDEQNAQQINDHRTKGIVGLEETREYYDTNIAKVHKKGDEELAREKDNQEFRLRNQRIDSKQEVLDAKRNHAEEMKDIETSQKTEQDRARIMNKQTLVQQRHEYDNAFQKNLKAFEATVKSQRDNLKHTLAREKREVINDVGRYNDKRVDPFYRLTQPAAEINETENSYVIRAHVPEHEKDNVKVIVHEDKVIVHGARRYQDQVEDVDVKIATNNYQTYRQEIPLEHPVREKLMHKTWADGILTVKIPKA